jgi:endonuclease/exonuclease/phosphatase family metal-dependent hydrolase
MFKMKHIIAGFVGLWIGCTAQVNGQEQSQALRVASYNIRHGEGADGKVDLPRIAKVIAALEPDLVALQEVDKNCTRSGNTDIAKELGKLLGMEHRFGKFMNFQGGEYGMAILSRLPIVDAVRHPLPDGAEPRCALEVRVHVDGLPSPVSFVCIHNDWTKESIRVKQAQALLEQLHGHDSPIVLAGDFNGDRSDESMRLLADAGWRIVKKNNDKESNTWPADDPRVEIDFFVIRNFPPVEIDHHVINEAVASDHRPIVAAISLSENDGSQRNTSR